MYNRLIKYHYYRIVLGKINDKGKWIAESPFLFSDWLGRQKTEDKIKKNVELSDCLVYIEKYYKEKDEDYYSVRFYKLRDTNVPSKIKLGNDAEPVELEEDEYIGEDMNVLYDRTLGVCMVQNNRMSVGVKRIEEWLTKDCGESYSVKLLPIYNKNILTKKIKSSKIRTIDITFSNLKNSNHQSLGDIISGIKRYDGLTGHITISVGKKKNFQLDNKNTIDLIEELNDNHNGIRSAKIKMREDDKGRIEVVDLFENVLHDYIPFEIETKKNLDFFEEHQAMMDCYKGRIDEIKQLIE